MAVWLSNVASMSRPKSLSSVRARTLFPPGFGVPWACHIVVLHSFLFLQLINEWTNASTWFFSSLNYLSLFLNIHLVFDIRTETSHSWIQRIQFFSWMTFYKLSKDDILKISYSRIQWFVHSISCTSEELMLIFFILPFHILSWLITVVFPSFTEI